MPEFNATAIAALVGGLAQPYIRALLARFVGLDTEGAAKFTYIFALVISAASVWITGGFADFKTPGGVSLLDPSALVAYLWPYFTTVFTISHVVFKTTEGVVAKVAGTGSGS